MLEQNNIFMKNDQINWEHLGKGVKRKIFGYDKNIMMVKVNFEKGAIGNLHSHHHSQVTYILNGLFEIQIGEEKNMLKSGDCFYVPPNVEHGAVNIEPGELIDVFSPIREDFLAGAKSDELDGKAK